MEIFKLLGTVAIKNSDAISAINETSTAGEKAQAKLSKAFSAIGSAAVAAGKVVAAGIGAGVTAMGTLMWKSTDSYAEYEQLVGGVETLFGAGSKSIEEYAESVGKTVDEISDEYNMLMKRQSSVFNNAAKAYQTAGLSANEYMSTVTSFAASLIQSLGDNASEAANMADMAITDMSDNANKMGTDMSLIQNAYQGFAKQNYTMLDNLKLGYGGTATEMARLINDSGVLGEKMINLADTQNIGKALSEVGFAKIIEAIHIIQEEMGITGTTIKEAGQTIQGSTLAMKAAWTNLVAGIADDNQDLDVLINNFVTSLETMLMNVMPRLEMILGGIGSLVEKIVPIIIEKLPKLVETLLPGLISAATSLLTGLIIALPEILQLLIEQIPYIVTEVAAAVMATFPILLETAITMFTQLWDYISLELLKTGASFEDTCNVVTTIFQKIWSVCQTIWNTVGKPIWDMISFALNKAKDLFLANMPAIMGFFQDAVSGIKDTWENHLKPTFDAIGKFLEEVVKPIFETVFEKIILPLVKGVFETIGALWLDVLKPTFDGICDFLANIFSGNWKAAWEGITDTFGTVFGNIVNIAKKPINAVISLVNDMIDAINTVSFDIPDWVPGLGGESFGFDIPNIPMLAKGGVLEKGQVGLLEGSGAEAVVPLEHNTEWINAVASRFNGVSGSEGIELLRSILSELRQLNSELLEKFIAALEAMHFEIDRREFARLVKEV